MISSLCPLPLTLDLTCTLEPILGRGMFISFCLWWSKVSFELERLRHMVTLETLVRFVRVVSTLIFSVLTEFEAHLQWNDEKEQDSVCCLKETNYYISTYFEKAQRKSGDLLQIATKSEPVVVWRSHTEGFHPKDCVNVDVGFVFLYLVALFSVAVWYYLVRLRKRSLFG